MGKLVLGVAALALSASAASAQQWVYPGYGYAPYGYGYASYGYGYAAPAPLYNYAGAGYGYAAPAYGAPATAGTTVIIINPSPAYTAPLYSYGPGYWGGYGRAGYGWR